jgi:hypothetical protein
MPQIMEADPAQPGTVQEADEMSVEGVSLNTGG